MSSLKRKCESGSMRRKRSKDLRLQLLSHKGAIEKFLRRKGEQQGSTYKAELEVGELIGGNKILNVSSSCTQETCDMEPETVLCNSSPITENTKESNCSESRSQSLQSVSLSNSENQHSSNSLETDEIIRKPAFPVDVGLWPNAITDEFREHIICNRPNQNIDKICSSKRLVGKRKRMLTEQNFYRKKKNGELVNREWLVYSPSMSALFCYVCKLFSSSDQALCKNGFSYWKNTAERLQEHENSNIHRNSVLCLSQRAILSSHVDSLLTEEYQKECQYWRKVLTRVVAVIKSLALRGLSLFGENETLYSPKNGNFLGSLELVSLFDPFLADHLLKYGNSGTGNANYLSSTTVTELIEIMAQKVLNAVVSEVEEAKYFGLIVDSTPDVAHIDQLAVAVRYVTKEGDPVERFLKFVPICGHDASHLCLTVTSLLKELNIDIINCRGQSYDNASNMSGKYSGLQAKVKELCPLAEYVPCSGHSLNLVGVHATECCQQAVSFFGLVQSIYNFFSMSPRRWQTLSSELAGGLHVKSLSGTRWSAAADASKALRLGYQNIMKALLIVSDDINEKIPTKHEAKVLLHKMEKFETAVLTVVWDTILQRLNSANKTLQSVTGDVSVLVPMYNSLLLFLQKVRDEFEKYELEATNYVKSRYSEKRKSRVPKSRMLDDSASVEVQQSDRDYFITQCHYVICDSLISELEKRKNAYATIDDRFGFLVKKDASKEIIQEAARCFQKVYSDDVDDEFEDEVYQFFHFLPKEVRCPVEKLKFLRDKKIVHTFPNVDTALRILLTMPISNCASERSFSVLKRVKNRLRTTMTQEKLTGLSILTIESDLTCRLDFEDVINNFAAAKARKRPL